MLLKYDFFTLILELKIDKKEPLGNPYLYGFWRF
jgi:hypothetical protein